jgi:ATP-dependent Lon protease
MVIPLFVGRDKSIRALDLAMEADKRILLVAQKSAETDDPARKDLYEIGTLAQVLQLLKLPDGTIKVLVEGLSRVARRPRRASAMARCGHGACVDPNRARTREIEAVARSLMSCSSSTSRPIASCRRN